MTIRPEHLADDLTRPPPKRYGEQETSRSQHQALDDEQPHEPASGGADRGAYGEFVFSPCRPREQQAAEIGARQQKEQAGQQAEHREGLDILSAEEREAPLNRLDLHAG